MDEFPLISLGGIEEPEPVKDGATWGRWRYDAHLQVLVHTGYPGGYDIDLEEVHGAGDVGKWVLHLANKIWITPSDIGDLVGAIRDCKGYWSW